MRRTPTILGAILLVVASCTFGSTRTIVTSAAVPAVQAVATNTDGDLMLIGTPTGTLVQANPATGAIQNTLSLWGGASTAAIALTPDGDDSGRVWSLHANGWIIEWDAGPTLTDLMTPPPLGAGTRTYCDLDHTQDDDHYLSTLDNGQAKLWRRDGTTGAWSSVGIGDATCPRIAHDLYHDELYLLRNGHTLELRNPTSLALLDTMGLDVDSGSLADLDVFGGAAVGAGLTAAVVLPWGGGVVPPVRMAWSYDLDDDGAMLAAKILGGAAPSSVHITVNDTLGTAELLVGSLAGTATVRGVQLLDD